METVKKKSRYLTPFQYFETIQLEYICADLRSKIYIKKQDRDFWKKVSEGKRVTIEKISDRNHLPNIFTDSDLLSSLERRIYRDETYPIFIYKDEEQKLSQEYLDLLYYYYEGVEVRFVNEVGESCIGKVKKYKPFSSSIVLLYNNTEVETKVSSTRRIL